MVLTITLSRFQEIQNFDLWKTLILLGKGIVTWNPMRGLNLPLPLGNRVQIVAEDWKKFLKITIDFSTERVEITEITIL